MKIRQHVPNFCDGVPKREAEFNNLNELLSIDWVKSWSDYPNFTKYSLSRHALMMEAHVDNFWWVIGYIEGDVRVLNLDKFDN